MTAERWQQVERIYHEAAAQPPSKREAFLSHACAGDPELRKQVERMLSGEARPTGFLQTPAADTGARAPAGERISPGSYIGPYEIVSLLGAGGMGEVYKAHDPRLNRTVAIKVLPQHAAGDADRRERLLREARTASALNHPNIVTIHDILSAAGQDCIVMEYVEGSTLAEKIGRKGLPLRDTLQYGIQIAGALAAAHGAGIVHRDIKPQNVMVTEPGAVKVLDFGLAQLQPAVGPGGETATLTAEGTIAGTVAYMAPEQAEGKRVDSRSDIFAFGSVLYEMATGRPAFQGDSKLSILTAILHQDPPPLCAIRSDASPELEKLIERCLRKDPVRRLHSMHDVRLLLEELRDSPAASPPQAAATKGRWLSPLLVAACSLAAGGLLALLWLPSRGTDLSTYHLTPFATEAGEENSPAWSPDGRTLAYEYEVDGTMQIYTRSLDAATGTRVTSSSHSCGQPFWSPDGGSIYYISQSQLWSVGAAGGVPRVVAKDVVSASISPDGKTLVFARGLVGSTSLWTASPPEADPQPYGRPPFSDKLALMTPPQFSPDGSKIAVAISRKAATSEPELWLVPFPSGLPVHVPVRIPAQQGGNQRPSWMPDSRRLVLSSGGHLYMADTHRGDLRRLTATTEGEVQPAVSPDGRRIAFASGRTSSDVVEIAFGGSPVRTLSATSRSQWSPTWSPQGTQYAYVTDATGAAEIWLRSAQEEWARPLVQQGAALSWYDLQNLHFSPDGRRIAYDLYRDRHVIAISSVAGGQPVIPDQESPDHHGPSWSPDGNWIAYRRLNGAKWELVKRPLGGGQPVWLEEAAQGGGDTEWSPSGEWICHMWSDSLHVVSADGARHVVAASPGTAAFGFSRDSATLYAIRRNAARKWELASIAIPSGQEKKVVSLDLPVSARVNGFSVHPGGKSFITSVGKSRFDIWLLEGFSQR